MYKYSKILVGLDHTETDENLIKAASYVSELSGSKEIFFINIIKDFNLPEPLQKEFPLLLDRAIEERKSELQAKIDKYFSYNEETTTVNIIVEQGQVTKSLLKFSVSEKIDLIVLGRKNEKKSGGVLINRIARRAGCSLLVIPKGCTFKVSNILVPTDFSDYSKKAMEKVATLARKAKTNPKITIQNVYQVPVGYHYTGKSFKEFADIMKSHAKNDYKKFINDINLKDLNIEEVYSLDKDEDIITDIYKTAKKIKADLIVIGAKGRTATTALFIGSKAERLIQVDSEISMLVVRPKGKRAGFLEYIKDL